MKPKNIPVFAMSIFFMELFLKENVFADVVSPPFYTGTKITILIIFIVLIVVLCIVCFLIIRAIIKEKRINKFK